MDLFKFFLLSLLLILLPFLSFPQNSLTINQFEGNWVFKSINYDWNRIYDDFDYNYDFTKYSLRKTVTTFIDNIIINFEPNNKFIVYTLYEYYEGYWKYGFSENCVICFLNIEGEVIRLYLYYIQKLKEFEILSRNSTWLFHRKYAKNSEIRLKKVK